MEQATLFASTFVGLGVTSLASAAAYDSVRPNIPYDSVRPNIPNSRQTTWDYWEAFSAIVLGLVFLTAGRSHFTVPEAFRAIYPPPGTWGIWYLPGSAAFHVAWTGVAELCGGAGLLVGGVLRGLALPQSRPLLPFAARAVALLVVCVTPANFYLFSHGAIMPGIVDDQLPMVGHAVRFVAQASVLSVLLTLSEVLRQNLNAEAAEE